MPTEATKSIQHINSFIKFDKFDILLSLKVKWSSGGHSTAQLLFLPACLSNWETFEKTVWGIPGLYVSEPESCTPAWAVLFRLLKAVRNWGYGAHLACTEAQYLTFIQAQLQGRSIENPAGLSVRWNPSGVGTWSSRETVERAWIINTKEGVA